MTLITGKITVASISSNNYGQDSQYKNLTFRQALYDFPHAEIAVLDEDGYVVAANPLWLECSLGNGVRGGLDNDKTPALGTDYFDVCRASFDDSTATALIGHLKQVIVGRASSYLMEYSIAKSGREHTCRLMAFSLIGSPNSLMLVHETNEKTSSKHREPLATRLLVDPVGDSAH
jgi:hypothetical protein